MLKPTYLYRNVRAGELLELFMVSAISSLLLTRFFLAIAGYPSVGGNSLHIAHMLYGGIFMVTGLVIMMAFIGMRAQRLASIISGIGFGLFIDELGKFITRDNNYFFRPTVALLYLIFMILFIAFRSLARYQRLTKREYLLNALLLAEEAVIDDMDVPERKRTLMLLHRSDSAHPLVAPLQAALKAIAPIRKDTTSFSARWTKAIEDRYRQLTETKVAVRIIDFVFVGKAAIFLISVVAASYAVITDKPGSDLAVVYVLQIISSLVASVLVVWGVAVIRANRLKAYNLFLKSLLVDIFVTQFFSFYEDQFTALLPFILNVALYIALRFLLTQERRLQHLTSA